jgi:hypothetical protein
MMCLKLAHVSLALAGRLALESKDGKVGRFRVIASDVATRAAPSKLHAGNAA